MSTKRKKPVAKRRSAATKRTRKTAKSSSIRCRLHIHALLVTAMVVLGALFVYNYGVHSAEAATCQSVAIPAYSYPNPTTFWDGGISAHPPVSIMIADPGNGPGSFQDSNYVAVIARAKAAGIKVLGYVDTNYAAVSSSTVKTDVDTWKTLYGINDIFFDQTSSGAGDLPYYQDIADYVHATSGAITMFNPGTTTVEGYMAMADILNIFEGSQTDYSSFSMPSWTNNYPASRFSQLIYAVPDAANMTSTLATSVSRHAGYVYITDDTLPNPWDQLPPYWSTEVSQINTACNPPASGGGGSSSPSPSPSPSSSSGSGTASKTGSGTSGTASSTPPPASPSSSASLSPITSQTAAAQTEPASSIAKSMPVKSRWWPIFVAAGAVVVLVVSLGGLWFLHRWRGHHLIKPTPRPPTIFPTAALPFR